MKALIQPSQLHGRIHAPASKSSMQRALAAALLTKGNVVIENPGKSFDDLAAMSIIQSLGATIDHHDDTIMVQSDGINALSNEVNCSESGLGLRMFTPIIALQNKEMLISGKGSLLKRPMHFFDDVLPALGVKVRSNNGFLPIHIKGPLKALDIKIDGSLSSQFLTGLLMAYSVAAMETVTITVHNLKSRPYIDLTLKVMEQFEMNTPVNDGYKYFTFNANHKRSKKEIVYYVEGDWSGGAFLLVAGAIAGPITITGLDMSSTQADRAILDAMSNANASYAIEAKGIKVHPGGLNAFEFDATECPDLFPPLVALAVYCSGVSRIHGTHRLSHKESDRAASLVSVFSSLGIRIREVNDHLEIHGSKVRGSEVHSHYDHRIAMAAAVAALGAEGQTSINDADAVNKSYPDFFRHLQLLGANVSLTPIT